MSKLILDKVVFGRLIHIKLSDDWDGWDVGLFSCKIVSKEKYGKAKALRLVIWRLVVWVELK